MDEQRILQAIDALQQQVSALQKAPKSSRTPTKTVMTDEQILTTIHFILQHSSVPELGTAELITNSIRTVNDLHPDRPNSGARAVLRQALLSEQVRAEDGFLVSKAPLIASVPEMYFSSTARGTNNRKVSEQRGSYIRARVRAHFLSWFHVQDKVVLPQWARIVRK